MSFLLEFIITCFLIYLMLTLNGLIIRSQDDENPCLRGSL